MQALNHIIIDRYFYECLKKIQKQLKTHINFFVIRSICFLIVIPTDHFILSSQSQKSLTLFTYFLISFLIINLMEMSMHLYLLFAKLKNKGIVVKIAEDFKHCRLLHDERFCKLQEEHAGDEIEGFQVQQSFGLKVSTQYYDYENLQKINDVSQEFRLQRQKNGQNNIKTQLQKLICCHRFISITLQLCSFAAVVFGIVASNITSINQPEHNILELLIISELLFKPHIYSIIFLIACIPFILLIICIYFCWCKRTKTAILPGKVKANAQIISKCSECVICFQNYDLEQEVIVLQCSQMHVFHENCITGWTKIKASCPICRKDLSQN